MGRSYRQCSVLQVAADGITFRHSKGMAKVLFTDLNEKLQARFGYDPEKLKASEKAKREATAKAREAAIKVAQQNAQVNAEAYTAALERQTLVTLQQLLRRPVAAPYSDLNSRAIGALQPLGYIGYGGFSYNNLGSNNMSCNLPRSPMAQRGYTSGVQCQPQTGSSPAPGYHGIGSSSVGHMSGHH
jgi:hypothetical protein